jgi:hypothetical protein
MEKMGPVMREFSVSKRREDGRNLCAGYQSNPKNKEGGARLAVIYVSVPFLLHISFPFLLQSIMSFSTAIFLEFIFYHFPLPLSSFPISLLLSHSFLVLHYVKKREEMKRRETGD